WSTAARPAPRPGPSDRTVRIPSSDDLGHTAPPRQVQKCDRTAQNVDLSDSIDKRPCAIVRPRGVADVMAAVRVARDHDLLVAVRSGGHSVAGHSTCDGGLVIDLGGMKGIRVDPFARRAHVQPGVVWSELDRETQAFGLATTGGL